MDKSSSQISDSPSESQNSPSQNENNTCRYSFASTDDFSSLRALSLPCLDIPQGKSSYSKNNRLFKSAPLQHTILDFLEAKAEMKQKNKLPGLKKATRGLIKPKQSGISFSVVNYALRNSDDEKESQFVEYTIKAVDQQTSESWEFISRYSMLREFYLSLKAEIPAFKKLNLPKFPSKKWFSNTDSSFLKKRSLKLSAFFQALSSHESVMNCKTMQSFITESREAADEEFVL